MARRSAEPYLPFSGVAPDQTCKHCNKPFLRNHGNSPLFAVICLHMGQNNCRPRWDQHGLLNTDGKPYLSVMEQIGTLAGQLEELGPLEAYTASMESIRFLVSRLSRCPVEWVKPVEDWFLDAEPE